MPIKQLEYPKFQVLKNNGDPLVGGKIYTYVAGTVSTDLTTWSDADKTSANANPVILDSRGEAAIWFDAPMKVKVTDADDSVVWNDMDDIPPNASPAATGSFNLVLNGSFEDSDTELLNWTTVPGTGGTISLTTTEATHGTNAIKFVGTDSTGGGSATSTAFPVDAGKSFLVHFTYLSANADTTNTVAINYYNLAGSLVSTDTVYTEAASNPTSFTDYYELTTTPPNALTATMTLTGVASGGTTTTSSTIFDNVGIKEECSVIQLGVASPANYLEVSNSAGTDAVEVTVNGSGADVDLNLGGKGTGDVTVATNRVLTVADEGTGNALDADTVDSYHAAIANTASTCAVRSAGNDIAATTFTGNLTGDASGSSGSCTGNSLTATTLEASRTINGVSFDGSANISVPSHIVSFSPVDTVMYPVMVGLASAPSDQDASIDAGMTWNALTNSLTISGNVDANTIETDSIQTNTTDGDLELTRNGTGDVTVDGTPVYGMNFVSPNVDIVSANTTSGSWVQVDMSTVYAAAHTAGAQYAVVEVILSCIGDGTSTVNIGGQLYIKDSGSGVTTGYERLRNEKRTSTDTTARIDTSSEILIKLDSNSDFWWYASASGSGTPTTSVTMRINAYYV